MSHAPVPHGQVKWPTQSEVDARVLLSQSPRPWNSDRVSLISAAFARSCGTRYSHASLDVDGMTFTFMTSGLTVRPREVFEARMFEVYEVPISVGARVAAIKDATSGPAAYDWAALGVGLRTVLRRQPLAYMPIQPMRYTCTSFVAYVCGLQASRETTTNRLVTTDDILRIVMNPERSAS